MDVRGFVLCVYVWPGALIFMGSFESSNGNGPLSRRIRELQGAARSMGPARTPGMLTSISTQGSISRPRTIVVPRRAPVLSAARWS